MAFVPVAPLAALPAGGVAKHTAGGRHVLLYREGDAVTAVAAHCTHYPVGLPAAHEAGVVTCGFHGAQYDLRSGAVVRPPLSPAWQRRLPLGTGRLAAAVVPKKTCPALATFPVRLTGDVIHVDVDAEAAPAGAPAARPAASR